MDTITNLLKALAEAISPYLPDHGTADETTVSDERVTALEERLTYVSETVENLPDVDEQIDEYLSYNFDPTDHDILTESRFDPSDFGLKTGDEITYEISAAFDELDIEERVTSCVEEHIEEAMNAAVEAKVASAVYAALDAAGVVTGTTLLTYLAATMDAACRRRGVTEAHASSFVAEGTEV